MSKLPVRLAAFAVAVLAASALACGGDSKSAAAPSGAKTCTDMVNFMNTCAAQLNTTNNVTVADCEAETCTNKQAAIDCIVATPCTDLTATQAAVNACLASGGCPTHN